MWGQARRLPQRQTTETAYVPAPSKGFNSVAPGGLMPALYCVYLYNLIASEHGLRTRLGYMEHCTGLTGALDNYVRSHLPFTGSLRSGSKDRLFATTSTGIWDVTSSSAAPSLVYTLGIQTGRAGWGVSHAVVTSGGHFLLYCDEENGLITYTESSDTWAAVTMGVGGTQISGVDPATFAFVGAFKSRVFFVQKDTQSLWYLVAGSVYGPAAQLPLTGAGGIQGQSRHGGSIAGFWNWTYDGGSGIDDALVIITQGGDVLIYQGTDPASASTFGLKGVWFVGGVPSGRRIATDYGGDLLILSVQGILPLSELVAGKSADDPTLYVTRDISNTFNALVQTYKSLDGWAVHIHPTDNALLVTYPFASGSPTKQLAMSFATRGWSQYRDLPIYSAGVWNGNLYFGTTDGTVCINSGYVDGVMLSSPSTYTPVDWGVLTAFTNGGSPRHKKVSSIQPTLLSEVSRPPVVGVARYDFDFREPDAPSVALTSTAGNSWDSATWDDEGDLWGDGLVAWKPLLGAFGEGRDVAVALRGIAACRTILVGVDICFEQGEAF